MMSGDIIGDVFVGDILGCFGGGAEEWRAFSPSHLEGARYDEFDIVARVNWREDVRKFSGVVCVDDHSSVSIFEVDFGEHERDSCVWREGHGPNEPRDDVSEFVHGILWC